MDISIITNTLNSVRVVAEPIIKEVAPKIQETMKAVSEGMLRLSESYPSLESFAESLNKVSDIMGDVLKVLDIASDTSAIIGFKVQQSEKNMDEFDSVEAYIKYLNDEIKLDREKFDNLTEEEKVSYTVVGLAVETGVISEKLGIKIPVEAVEMLTKLGNISVEASKLVNFISKLKEEGIDDFKEVYECIKGEGNSDRVKTGEALVSVLNELEEGEGNKVLNEIIDEIRE